MTRHLVRFLVMMALTAPLCPAKKILVVTADASDYILAAGGTLAKMIASGDTATLVRVTNDDKESWKLSAEETARRTTAESEAAAKILGIAKVVSLGYRAGELAGVSPTELRDRITFYIRLVKPDVLFIPNPYAEYVEVIDRYHTGQAAEEARRAAALVNYQPAFAAVGMEPHVTPELYYYAQPFDPRRREPESTATFVPQPTVLDISQSLDKKIKAAQALKTINENTARQIKQRLDETNRKLALLDKVDDGSVTKLVDINVRKLAEISAKGSSYKQAEEFHYAGKDYQIPAKFRK